MLAFAIRIIIAAAIGLIMGWISSSHYKQVERIFSMICMGAALVTITSIEFFQFTETPWLSDPGRISAQILPALGFLGTGLIFVAQDHKIKGLSIAASLWVTAILGILVGLGRFSIVTAVLFSIFLIYFISKYINSKYRIPGN